MPPRWHSCWRNVACRTRLPPTAQGDAVQQRYEQATQQAFDAGVFGAPSYVIDGEIFWGQDRLDFVERRLVGRATGQATRP